MAEVKLHRDWLARIGGEFEQPYMAALKAFLSAERDKGKVIHPRPRDWFAALDATPPQDVRVVILGQDPYHGPGQAHGLCFSVQPGVRTPPSLVNIYKEMQSDLGIARASHGYLGHWAQQGVLLLNNCLTVESGMAASHQGKGWERFTDAVVAAVAADPVPKVFILWGSHAQKKAANVLGLKDGGMGAGSPHLILRAPHPSPLSAHNGFFGSRPFSQANAFLEAHGRGTIDWKLPETAGIAAA
ncbi:uracil-DNA glycosylase [Sphingopyxis sp. RIFCSPHIGHO2_12_FULL_65_19]|uniref:uracil-DNA glycosylase n=1 Tax=Sphingopyxis sp. RIFCSPHIGHO2_12_FULL_65_19 TaxID=1802172 RepID=UPI0008B3DE02|nr:uracil-DNA glycosylase [Sphingopyxis sp. RIFCSPHIGHO2_12_FULL_65_19]OHD05950.1 MAG: uracil-DNA glycosylase [Sphingopyxis sp. RIFCSPHIGHO2_12_FULL_65_19]